MSSVRFVLTVRELGLRPASSWLKFPNAVLGTSPAIKLVFVLTTQVGVNGQTLAVPCWFAVVTVTVAKAEPAKASNALSVKTRLFCG